VGIFLFENYFVEHPVGCLINKPQYFKKNSIICMQLMKKSPIYQFQVPVEYILSVSECPIQHDFFLYFIDFNEDYDNG
jgi:hypothetical protein